MPAPLYVPSQSVTTVMPSISLPQPRGGIGCLSRPCSEQLVLVEPGRVWDRNWGLIFVK